MSDWQPIETAPEDVLVLVYVDHVIVTAELSEGMWGALTPNGWSFTRIVPTHWMPLPEPPQ